MKTVYSYNPINREFNGEIIARKDPLEKKEKFLVPANAVEEKPIFQEGKITKFVNGQWILENISLPPEPPEPTLEEELQKAKNIKIAQCKSYLTSTDWYVIRKADNGTAIPTQIAENRELARALQDDINADDITIEELNAINIEF